MYDSILRIPVESCRPRRRCRAVEVFETTSIESQHVRISSCLCDFVDIKNIVRTLVQRKLKESAEWIECLLYPFPGHLAYASHRISRKTATRFQIKSIRRQIWSSASDELLSMAKGHLLECVKTIFHHLPTHVQEEPVLPEIPWTSDHPQ